MPWALLGQVLLEEFVVLVMVGEPDVTVWVELVPLESPLASVLVGSRTVST